MVPKRYTRAKPLREDTYTYYIHICWFNIDALAQGNAYKPTKEPINYRGPGGDRTHDLQTEATPPAASCPARTLHATEIAPKTQYTYTHPYIYIYIYIHIHAWTQTQHTCVYIIHFYVCMCVPDFLFSVLSCINHLIQCQWGDSDGYRKLYHIKPTRTDDTTTKEENTTKRVHISWDILCGVLSNLRCSQLVNQFW